MSALTQSDIFASRSHSSDSSRTLSQASLPKKWPQGYDSLRSLPDPDHVELRFLRVVGRNKVPIAVPDDIQLDCLDQETDDSVKYGVTMEVHKGSWKGQRIAAKYIRRSYSGESYRRAMVDLNFELQLMSKSSLCEHRNITRLLAVCFNKEVDNTSEPPTSTVYPGLVVELAHEQYPDLGHFFDMRCGDGGPKRLPFQTSANLVADVADGMAVLHDHDIVHGDLKPSNILLFPDIHSPGDLVAKIADFGFVGMTTYTSYGKRSAHAANRPRGGTAEWSAPECLDNPDPWIPGLGMEYPQYKNCIDIYSFGLLSCYVALDGQTPGQYVPDLSRAKLSGNMLDKAITRLGEHYCGNSNASEKSFKESAIYIAQQTLNLCWEERIKSLRSIRGKIFGTGLQSVCPAEDKFVLDFNLFPPTAHVFKCEGLYRAYWGSPPEFRAKVYESFQRISSGMFGQIVSADVWACMEDQS